MGKTAVELGGLYSKSGTKQPVWRVVGFVEHASLPHARLSQVGAPATQITMSFAALDDPRFYRRLPHYADSAS